MGNARFANGSLSNFDNESCGFRLFAVYSLKTTNRKKHISPTKNIITGDGGVWGKKDVKLMKKFISEEIMLSFPAPHKLDLSVRSNINESDDNEKGEIIEG